MAINFAWEDIRWHNVEQRILRYQHRIYKASLGNNRKLIRNLQKIIINSLDAKLLSVRQVTTLNKGKRTPGTDMKTYLSSSEKVKLVRKLRVDGKANSIKRIFIPKSKGKLRPLGIPTILDRAKQHLVLLALDPEWEAKHDTNSYGFRPGRCVHDAVESIYCSLSNTTKQDKYSKYVLDGDIKGCFDNIDHSYILKKLDTLPEIENQINSWLKAGIFELTNDGPLLTFSERGTPQGGIISPLLANIALNGLEPALKEWITTELTTKGVSKRDKQKSLAIIRYADDFIVLHKSKEIVLKARDFIENWLNSTSKLSLNIEKTTVINSSQGFDFLGFRFINVQRHNKSRIKIYPTKANIKSIIEKISTFSQKNRSISSYDYIEQIRPIIFGWAHYYRYCECSKTFHQLDYKLWNVIRSWVFRRDRSHGRRHIKLKYFPSGQTYTYDNRKYQDNWILNGKKRVGNKVLKNWLPRIQWIKKLKFIKVRGKKSIYDGDTIYWTLRSSSYGITNIRKRKLLKMQDGICPLCNQPFKSTDQMEVDHILPISLGGKDVYKNLQLVHRQCHIEKTRLDSEHFP